MVACDALMLWYSCVTAEYLVKSLDSGKRLCLALTSVGGSEAILQSTFSNVAFMRSYAAQPVGVAKQG